MPQRHVFHAGRRQFEDEDACGFAPVVAKSRAAIPWDMEGLVLQQDGIHVANRRGDRPAGDEPDLFAARRITGAFAARCEQQERTVETCVIDHRLGEQPRLFGRGGVQVRIQGHRRVGLRLSVGMDALRWGAT